MEMTLYRARGIVSGVFESSDAELLEAAQALANDPVFMGTCPSATANQISAILGDDQETM